MQAKEVSAVLDEDAEKALERPEDGAMHHNGLLTRAIRAHVLEPKAIWQVEVALYRRALPEPADGILDLQVDLRPVESATALVHRILPSLAVKCFDERGSRFIPDLVGANGLLWRVEHHLVL